MTNVKKLLGYLKLMQVFSLRGILRGLLMGIAITLVTMYLGMAFMPIINIYRKDKELKHLLPGLQNMIYAARSYVLPEEEMDFRQLTELPEIEEVFYTGDFTCSIPSGEWVYVSFLSSNLYDTLRIPAESRNRGKSSDELSAAFCSQELKTRFQDGEQVDLAIQRANYKISENAAHNFSAIVSGFLVQDATVPMLKANAAPYLSIDDIGGRIDSQMISGMMMIRAGSEEDVYLRKDVALLKVAKGRNVDTVLEKLREEYGSFADYESYQGILASGYSAMLMFGGAGILRLLIVLAVILAVNVFGALLIDRENNLRSDMILYQLGLTRPAITGLHLIYTILFSLPWMVLGVIRSKPHAEASGLQGSWGYTKEVVMMVAVCYLLVLLAVGLTFSLSQKRRSASEIYKEA